MARNRQSLHPLPQKVMPTSIPLSGDEPCGTAVAGTLRCFNPRSAIQVLDSSLECVHCGFHFLISICRAHEAVKPILVHPILKFLRHAVSKLFTAAPHLAASYIVSVRVHVFIANVIYLLGVQSWIVHWRNEQMQHLTICYREVWELLDSIWSRKSSHLMAMDLQRSMLLQSSGNP
jgi:hypothetical protein